MLAIFAVQQMLERVELVVCSRAAGVEGALFLVGVAHHACVCAVEAVAGVVCVRKRLRHGAFLCPDAECSPTGVLAVPVLAVPVLSSTLKC